MAIWTNIKRVARYGLIGFVRNGFVSLSAVLVMTITLFVVACIIISNAALHSTLQQLTDKVDVTVYFQTEATDTQITQVQKLVEALPEVASVSYESRDEALATFRERHKNDQITLQALDELSDNPLGASLKIRAKQTSQYESIAQFLDTQQKNNTDTGIDKINFFRNKTAIDQLTSVIDASKRIGFIIAFVLGFSSLLIVLNTIRLAIYTARDEIGVMNLVGATHWYVRGPFIMSGVLYGIIAGLLVLALLYPLAAWLGPASERFFGNFNVFSYFVEQFPMLFLVIVSSGIGLGALSSYLAVRRYLRM